MKCTPVQPELPSKGHLALLSRAFPNIAGLLALIPRPGWATSLLVVLGILASLAEAGGILLIPLFIYSAMNQLGSLVAARGLVSTVLRFVLQWFHGSGEITLVFLILIVLRGLIAYGYGLATARIGERISQITRDRVHMLYLRLPYQEVQRRDQAELVEALGREAWLPSNAYHSLTRILVNATFILTLGGILVLFSWQITIGVLVGSVLLSATVHLFSARAHAIGNEEKRVHQLLWDHMMVTLQGMRTIRAFGQEQVQVNRFNETSFSATQVAIRTLQLTLLLDPLTEVGYLLILGVIVVCAPRSGISFATILTSIALLYRLQPHVREIEGHRLNLLQLEPQLQSVRSILEEGQNLRPRASGIPVPQLQHAIRFEQVSFRYQEEGPFSLKDVSFEMPAGRTTALVGASGSGKTTIVNLLLSLYSPNSGTTYVDDIPLNEIDMGEWAKFIGVAGQDVDLIEGSILDNIKMADAAASDESVDRAAQVAGLSELIESLPDGYRTWVGRNGLRFSGGQRQRIGLARAILRNPKFLILDEAMNAMDLELEHRIRANVEGHFAGSTILLITHRLESVLTADHIVYIANGQIVAQGGPSVLSQYRHSSFNDLPNI